MHRHGPRPEAIGNASVDTVSGEALMVHHTTEAKMRFGARTIIVPGVTGTGRAILVSSPRRGMAARGPAGNEDGCRGHRASTPKRRTARTLGALDDHMLKDLGLTRTDPRGLGSKDDIRNWRTINRWR